MILRSAFIAVVLAGIAAAPACADTHPELNPALIMKAAAPRAVHGGVLFTCESPSAARVYLAGDFNNWADNDGGKVSGSRFEMSRASSGVWYKVLPLKAKTHRYKFVISDGRGKFDWRPDPHAPEKDGDQNSVFDFATILRRADATRKLIAGRRLEPMAIRAAVKDTEEYHIESVIPDKVWYRPKERAVVTVVFGNVVRRSATSSARVRLRRLGAIHTERAIEGITGRVEVLFETDTLAEGGYAVEAEIRDEGRVIDRTHGVLSIVQDISDDLRYGFYSNWGKIADDYDAKADFFARLYINAIEFYDYFPAHGVYAPREKVYKYEPFGIEIQGEDVRRKIESAAKRNILSIAYIAAYSASESVYRKNPYPMTDRQGVPRVFHHYVLTEAEAKRQNKPIWFYLMAIARDSKWRPTILEELRRALDDSPDDLVSFDGFEIDSYGHAEDDRYYSKDSGYSGQPLSAVIMGFVSDVRDMTHEMKPRAAVSFNCVNEFGIEKMYNAVDFLFIEDWAKHKSDLEDLVDLCYTHRRPKLQRVILKIYPADTRLGQKFWPAASLRYILGAAMTGGGSVMVAGEPDEVRGDMHGLNSLYYPDNVAMPGANFDILRDYNQVDALLYRLTHGKNVRNLETDFELPGCVVRAFDSADSMIAVQILRTETNRQWDNRVSVPEALRDYEIAFKMPDGRTPLNVYYVTPDFPELRIPQSIDWEFIDGHVRALIPRLSVYGVVLIETGG